MGQGRRNYTDAFKANALKVLLEEGGNISATARKVGVDRHTMRDWKKQANLPVAMRKNGEAFPEQPFDELLRDRMEKAQVANAEAALTVYEKQSEVLEAAAADMADAIRAERDPVKKVRAAREFAKLVKENVGLVPKDDDDEEQLVEYVAEYGVPPKSGR